MDQPHSDICYVILNNMNKEGNNVQFVTFFHCIIRKYTDNSINTEEKHFKICVYVKKTCGHCIYM